MSTIKEIIRQEKLARVASFISGSDAPPLIEIAPPFSIRKTNWFRQVKDKLRIYAFLAFTNGIFSGKLYAANGLFRAADKAGKFDSRPFVVAPTSGNLGKDGAYLASLYPTRGFKAVVNFGTPAGKLDHLRISGAEVIIAPEGTSAINHAYQLAKLPGHILMDQYTDEGSIEGHRGSMNQIASEIKMRIGNAGFIFGAVTGTGSTLVGAHRYLRSAITGGVKILAVSAKSKMEKIPGGRSPEEIAELEKIGGFPYREEWRSVLSFPMISSITRGEVYSLNAELVRETCRPIGPTGALLMAGGCRLVRDHVERGDAGALENEDGRITLILFFMDSYLAYAGDPDYRKYFENQAAS